MACCDITDKNIHGFDVDSHGTTVNISKYKLQLYCRTSKQLENSAQHMFKCNLVCERFLFSYSRQDLSKVFSYTTVKKCIQLYVSVFFHRKLQILNSLKAKVLEIVSIKSLPRL